MRRPALKPSSADAYLEYVDMMFSPFKEASEVSRINRGELALEDACADMQPILMLAEQTRHETDGYFDIVRDGKMDPCGIVNGWAIYESAELLRAEGFEHLYVDAGGDIQMCGLNDAGRTGASASATRSTSSRS